mgnify:CR=1 FL=1
MKKTKELVSIIMPTYNCGEFIERTINSIIDQTYTKWELIIVDDCSKDNTQQVLQKYKLDKRINYIKLAKNSGAAVARTEAIKRAKGNYIAFLDSDDIWYPEKLTKQLKFMQTNNYDFTCTAYEQIDENDKSLNKIIKTKKRADYNRILLDCPVGNSTVMYNVDKLGKFEVPNIRKRNDDALWLQIIKKAKYIYGYNEVLMKYRIRRNSISRNKLSLIKYHWQLYREIEHLSVIRSIFHICYWGAIKMLHIK